MWPHHHSQSKHEHIDCTTALSSLGRQQQEEVNSLFDFKEMLEDDDPFALAYISYIKIPRIYLFHGYLNPTRLV